jgi:transcription antitermination factor NusG
MGYEGADREHETAGRDPFADFSTAIDAEASRSPRRHIVNYFLPAERSIRRIIDHVGLDHDVLTFQRRTPRKRLLVTRHWFPGYLFLLTDADLDRWQQLLRVPGVFAVLGSITDQVFIDIQARCPGGIMRNDALSVIPAGSDVEIIEGTMRGTRGVVSASSGSTVWVEVIAFNRPVRAQLSTRAVLVMG